MVGVGRLRRIAGPVQAFAECWQREPWAVSRLHWALDVPLTIQRGGWRILGLTVADAGYYSVAISHRVVGTPLEPLVRGHEGVHVLLGLPCLTGCRRAWLRDGEECGVWVGTALLLVPDGFARGLRRGELSPGEAAYHTDAPPAMLRMRLAADGALHQRAWRSRYLAELAQAQHDLQDWMTREVMRLRRLELRGRRLAAGNAW